MMPEYADQAPRHIGLVHEPTLGTPPKYGPPPGFSPEKWRGMSRADRRVALRTIARAVNQVAKQ